MPVHNNASGNNNASAQTPATPAKAASQGKTKAPKRGSAKWQQQQTRQKAATTAQASKSVASAAKSAELSQQPISAPAAPAASKTQAEEAQWLQRFPIAEGQPSLGWLKITIKGDTVAPPDDTKGSKDEPTKCTTAEGSESGFEPGTGSMHKVVAAFIKKKHFKLISKTQLNDFVGSRRTPDHAAILDDNGEQNYREVHIFFCHDHGKPEARGEVDAIHRWLIHHWAEQYVEPHTKALFSRVIFSVRPR